MTIYQRKGSRFYLLDVVGPDGRRTRRSSKTENYKEALRQHTLLEAGLGPVFDIQQAAESVSLTQLAEQFVALRANTRSCNISLKPTVNVFLEWAKKKNLVQIENITLRNLQEYQAFVLSRRAPATSNRAVSMLKVLFGAAVDWEYLSVNPAKKLKKVGESGGRRRFLDSEEQKKALAACKGPLRSLVLVALRTGMRRGELLRLSKRDVDSSRGHITVVENKTDALPRHIPLLPEVRETLLALSAGLADDAPLFRSRTGRPYSPNGVRTAWECARKRAGLDDVHFHDLRHSFASDCLAAGVPLRILQDWLGHKSLAMTMRYAHLHDRQIQGATEALERHLAAQLRHSAA